MQIETERLLLREYSETDWEAIHVYASQGEILQYEIWGPNSIEETKAFVARAIANQTEQPRMTFELCIVLKSSKQLIGGCGFRIKKDNKKRGDIGYIINPDYWNKGYATEATRGLNDHFLKYKNITEIEAKCDALNIASQKVLEKCGFRKVKEAPSETEIKGKIRQMFFYELI